MKDLLLEEKYQKLLYFALQFFFRQQSILGQNYYVCKHCQEVGSKPRRIDSIKHRKNCLIYEFVKDIKGEI